MKSVKDDQDTTNCVTFVEGKGHTQKDMADQVMLGIILFH